MANNRNKVIKKHSELKVSYGSRTNKYLAIWYGFALPSNCYDSYAFRIVVDEKLAKSASLTHGVLVKHIKASEKERKFITVNDLVISTDLITAPFKAKMSTLNNELIVYLRGNLYSQWLKDHPSKKKHKMTLSVPFDLSFEKTVIKRFIDIFTVLQLGFKRSDVEDAKLLEFGNLSAGKRAVVVCELGWKQILEEQIRMGKLIYHILKTLQSHPERPFRKVYMAKVSGVDRDGEPLLLLRLKIRNYLKRLMLSPFVASHH